MSDAEQRLAQLSPERRELLKRLSASERSGRGRIRPSPRPERIPLTFGQRRLWLLDQLSPGLTAYNCPAGIWLHGPADTGALRQAMQALVDRHEVLRTIYRSHNGEPHQTILQAQVLPCREVDAEGDSLDARRASAMGIARQESAKSFSLVSDLPMRGLIVRVTPELYLLHLVFHHIAIDGWSITLLFKELAVNYNLLLKGESLDAAATELQIADVALWQKKTFEGEGLRKQLDFWKEHLNGAPPVLDLPTDHPRPAMQSFRGSVWATTMPTALYERLQSLASVHQATMSMVVLAAFQALLSRYTAQEKIVTAVGSAGRGRLEFESVIGFFIGLLPLQADLSGDPDFVGLLAQVRDSMLTSMTHADAPFDRILEDMRLPRSPSYTPFAQVMYFFQSYPEQDDEMNGLRIEHGHLSEIRADTAQADLSLFVNQHAPGELMLEYSSDLYEEATIQRMGGHLLTMLTAVAEQPGTKISALPLLTSEECAQQAKWNDTVRALPEPPTIAALIAAQTLRTPDATAVVFAKRGMSYRELDRRANMVAHALRAHGVLPGILVGLYVERSLEMLIGLLGILKAGGAYVPLDPSYPAERLAYMVEMSASPVLVTQASLRDVLPAAVPAVVVVDADTKFDDTAEAAPEGGSQGGDPAYVIFTSGSTGKPKGVEILQKSAVNLLRSIARAPGMSEHDTICAISTLSFDIALSELVLPLTVGARILLVDRDTVRDGLALRKLVDAEAITIMQATPATWRMLLDVGWSGKNELRIISTGEALPRELADRLLPYGRELWNLYGPTETTVYSALCKVEAGSGPIIVGRPVDNTSIHIVDRHMQALPIGVPGELLIGGTGLAAGYRGRPDLTAEKFIPDIFSSDPTARLYRTGDLAMWREDGTVEVVGRIDHQIKLRGFRIELGEIESVLAQYPGVTQVVVHCREDRPGDRRLVAYFTADDSAALDVAVLREHLKQLLPDYMVPSAFVGLDEFPLTPNGKVDRNALPAPESAEGLNDATDFVAPRTSEEQELAKIWCELLGIPQIDARANFFNLGGHSLLGTRMLSRIDHEFGIELPLRALFDHPTLEAMADRIAKECTEADAGNLEEMLLNLNGMTDEEVKRYLERAGDEHKNIAGAI